MVVLGLGVSGRAARAALVERGAVVVTVDQRDPSADHDDAAALDLGRVALVVASPGWRPSHPAVARAVAEGVPVWSEVELAWRLRADRRDGHGPAPWLAVTGTNGKTTTVGMLTAVLTAAGLRAAAVGNIGTPVTAAATDPALDVLAVELSSFQLHFTRSMRPLAAAVLNIAPDHLDWHGGLAAYAAAKARVYHGAEVACVYDVSDPRLAGLVRDADIPEGARAIGFTSGLPEPGQLGLEGQALVDRAFPGPDARTELADLDDLAHLGGPGGAVAPYTVSNALAAAALARANGVGPEAVRDGLRRYQPAAHRSTPVATADGVAYVDDSKATNAHAAAASLAGFAPGSVVWIAGGLAKGAQFGDLVVRRRDRLRGVVLIGTDQAPWVEALSRHAPAIPVVRIDPADTGTVMTRAVDQARRLARPGDTVLLAPAGASMDQFASYEERGDVFARAVLAKTDG